MLKNCELRRRSSLLLAGIFSLLLMSCALKNKNATSPAPVLSAKEMQSQIKCESGETSKVLKMDLGTDGKLVTCGLVLSQLSDTIYEMQAVKVYFMDYKVGRVHTLVNLKKNEQREVLWNTTDRRVLLFEDVPLDKKLPLFSQEIVCEESGCTRSEKVCLFKKDEKAFIEPLQEGDLSNLMSEPEGQVRVLLAALSDFKPAIAAYQRTPQSLEGEAANTYKLRKQQLLQAQALCNKKK